MSRSLCPDPLPFQGDAPGRRGVRPGPARLGLTLGATLLLTACVSPGMKFDAKPPEHGQVEQMGDLKVTLRRIDASVLKALANRVPSSGLLADLVAEKPKPYQIGPQDYLLVTVWDHPEITLALGQYRTDNSAGNLVEDDGSIFFPYVGRIQVAGHTAPEVQVLLTTRLAHVFQNPQVDVKVLAFRSKKIYVGGEVKNPAVYTVTDVPFTLGEALNRAGGFTPLADDSRMLLVRGDRSWFLDLKSVIAQGAFAGKIYLQDGDTLLVPNNLEDPVYLMGEVSKPGSAPLVHGNLSLAKAISDVGGLIGTSADARSIYVIRQGQAANSVDVFHLDARNPTAMVLADRFALNPRDIVYVDAGSTVRFSRVMELVLPTFTAVTTSALTAAEVHYSFKK